MYHALRPNLAVKPLQEHPRSYRASGARPAGPLTRPHGKHSQTRREGRPIRRLQHLREPGRRTRRCSGATVGDSPEGTLKQLGKSRLKTCKKPKPNTSCLSAHTGHGPRRGGPGGPPRRPTQRSPRSRLRLAREHTPPSSGLRPVRGCTLTSSGLRLARGSTPTSNRLRLARGHPARTRRSHTQERAFNALTTAGQRHHAPGTHAPVLLHQLPRREPIPATVGDCATWPVSAP
jgi:hypothetical protein